MEEHEFKKKLFGGEIVFLIYGVSKEVAEEVIGKVYFEALRLEKIFNFYDPESELSKLNKSRKKKVSNELLGVLKKTLNFSSVTKGSYDVSLGKFILLQKKGEVVFPNCSYKDISIEGNNVSLNNSEVLIDLGSIAKGYITDRLGEFLQKKGISEFLIDSRGDILIKGKQIHILGVQNPREDEDICSIKLENQAVATSGDYSQYVESFAKSHILNQKTNISVTVVAPTLEEADLYATILFTYPEKEQEKILDSNKDIKALIIDKSNNLKMFNNFEILLI